VDTGTGDASSTPCSSSGSSSNSSINNLNCSNFEEFDYDGHDIAPAVPSPDQADCCAKCNAMANCSFYSFCSTEGCPQSTCYLKSSNAGRTVRPGRKSGPVTTHPPSFTLEACPSHYAEPGYDVLDDKGTYYAYNLLYELDQEGEYYVNRTSNMLYLWPPASASSKYWSTAPWGLPVVPQLRDLLPIQNARASQLALEAAARQAAAAAGDDDDDSVVGELSVDDDLLVLAGVQFLSLDGVVLTTSRNAAVRVANSSSITISNSVLQNTGSMIMNVSGGSGITLDSSVVRHGGNGAIFLYAGDRSTLTPAKHVVSNSSISYSQRYMYCYVPSVALADCGNSIVNSEIFGGPHQGIFISGNDMTVQDSSLHDLVEAVSDSGVIYMGRDFTYYGSKIVSNVFERINTVDSGDDVSAVYLDDQVSGFYIADNTFVAVARAVLLGGGRSNIIVNNTVRGVNGTDGAVHFDNRGMGWAAKSCTPPDGEMIEFLNRVPYTNALWTARYPELATILDHSPCVPMYNVVANNTFCGLSGGFIDATNTSIVSWNSTAYNNVPTATPC
jgi:hypothetical protein